MPVGRILKPKKRPSNKVAPLGSANVVGMKRQNATAQRLQSC